MIGLFVGLTLTIAGAQVLGPINGQFGLGTNLPGTCTAGLTYVRTSDFTMHLCTATNVWTQMSTGGGSGLPSGFIGMVSSGTCPTGTSEVAALNGKTLQGTLAANGDVGTTFGSDTITPAGTNSAPSFTGNAWSAPAIAWPAGVPTHSGITATFSGNALGTHAHELPWQIPTTTTIRQIAVGTFGTGTSRAATAVSAAGTANTTSAAVALSQAVSGGTPAGTVNITSQGTVAWPAGVPTIGAYTPTGTVGAPTFTGTQFDNRSAGLKVIFCKGN